jgi:hypothetical protein
MLSRTRYFIIIATLAAVVLILLIGIMQLMFTQITSPIAVLLTAILTLILSLAFLRWLGSRMDQIWRLSATDAASAALVRAIARRSNTWISVSVFVVIALYAVALLLFLPPEQLNYPLQPFITFIFSALWFGYILYSISQLTTAEADSRAMTSFARNSMAAAIALSIYFLLPFDWFATALFRAFETIVYGAPSGRQFSYTSANSTINWLQSTAIPSTISMAFGFLTAYVTALVWYEYYKSASAAGLEQVEVSRRGRDPARDTLWFGQLADTKNRVILCGLTLGGWFRDWNRFQTSLHELLARETVRQIVIILPEPGNAFFWQRRDDEAARERAPWDDPIVRLAKAIELLYLALPDSQEEHEHVVEFLARHNIQEDAEAASRFVTWFRAEFNERSANYGHDIENQSFSTLVSLSLPSNAAELNRKKLWIVFSVGTMMGVNIFDNRVHYTPYVPRIEDKDCPQFILRGNSPLATSVERSIDVMAREGIMLCSRSHALAMAFRLWRACQRNRAPLRALAEVPAWLNFEAHSPREGA